MFPVTIEHPIVTKKMPSNDKMIRFRPFLEKERKLLLMVAEGSETQSLKDIMNIIKQIAGNCLLDPIDMDTMTTIDLEWLFLQLRICSMGEIVKRTFICNNDVDDKPCNGTMDVDLDLTKVEVKYLDASKKIKLSPTVTIVMKWPTILAEDFETDYDAIIACIDYVADKDQVYYAKNYSKAEMNEFITHLSMAQFQTLEDFYNTTPMLTTTIRPICRKCGFNHEIVIEGLQSFFV